MTWAGGTFGRSATCVLAPNADFMTLDGTNTWVLSSGEQSLVVDPGPSIQAHLDAVSVVGSPEGHR